MVQSVHCPYCGKTVPWQAEQQWKPFCSERCKLIDLGEWGSEGYRIKGESVQMDLDNDEFNLTDVD